MTPQVPRPTGLKLLFLSTKATRPSHRFRVEQMLPFLEQAGHNCSVGFFPKNPIARLWFYRQLPRFDAVLIQQRTLHPAELSLLRKLAKRVVFDLDDSVMFDPQGNADRRRSQRFSAMVHAADLIICGNQFLSDQVAACRAPSQQFSKVAILPTAIDTERFRPGLAQKTKSELITIGWTGSRSTNRYLNTILPTLARVQGPIELKVISDTCDGLDFSQLGAIPVRFVKWSAETEAAETAEFDIGLMPLPDDDSTRGKCGCKALQYMALGIPAVCSPVGVNRDIIQDGQNGFLPANETEWKITLDRLVGDRVLLKSIGRNGRSTVESKYSLRIIVASLKQLLEEVCIPLRKAA